MSLLTRLFEKERPTRERATRDYTARRAHATDMVFNPELIATLHDGHRQLARHLDELALTLDAHDFLAVPSKLNAFRIVLEAHVRLENAHLYPYLNKRLAPYHETPALVASMQKDMEAVAGIALRFAQRYSGEPIGAHNEPAFRADLAMVEDLLDKRRKVEESQLYTLYLPP